MPAGGTGIVVVVTTTGAAKREKRSSVEIVALQFHQAVEDFICIANFTWHDSM